MAEQPLTSDQLEEIREAFKLFDTDDSGTIDSDGAYSPLPLSLSLSLCSASSPSPILFSSRVLASRVLTASLTAHNRSYGAVPRRAQGGNACDGL